MAAILLGGLGLYALVYIVARSHMPIDADGQGYYAYLPAYLVDHDLTFNTVIRQHILPTYAAAHLPAQQFGFSLQPTGAWLDKYGVGVAVLLLPFFLAGHGLALALGLHADGYTRIETLVSGAAAVVYVALGLWCLRAVLRRWFSSGVTAIVLVLFTLGTGVVNYFAWAPAFSHDFTVFAVSAMLLTALRWYERPSSWWRAALLGLAMGAVVAIRLTNVVLLAAVPLLLMGGPAAVRVRAALIARHAAQAGVAVTCALLCLLPQVATWYVATGHLITRPYPGESFDFAHPRLLESLVWLQPHGLLPYYPVMALAIAGLCVAWVRRRDLALPVTLTLLLFWYVSSSWWDWSFSDGFGDRAYIDVVPLAALPAALLLQSLGNRVVRRGVVAAGGVLAVVTCVLLLAYWQRALPQDGIDAAGYLHVLTHPQQLLHAPRG
ncbi:MAG: hypothetical protein JOZ46_02965 [Candidatus Dormibacteraeota bacterium]|nr:hypothetical protein [Candidatus Dormibacteraeota bacterium]MBV9524760.1 hypothetical protein [Candidatus Dormibacteraeota bacterium]